MLNSGRVFTQGCGFCPPPWYSSPSSFYHYDYYTVQFTTLLFFLLSSLLFCVFPSLVPFKLPFLFICHPSTFVLLASPSHSPTKTTTASPSPAALPPLQTTSSVKPKFGLPSPNTHLV